MRYGSSRSRRWNGIESERVRIGQNQEIGTKLNKVELFKSSELEA